MFAQMLEKVGPLPQATTQPPSNQNRKKPQHRFTGAQSARTEKVFTSSKSEVGAQIPDEERLTLRSHEDDEDDNEVGKYEVPGSDPRVFEQFDFGLGPPETQL